MKEYSCYIFDFDGTLCDTVEGVFNSIKYALSFKGIEETDDEKLRFFIGPPLYESFRTVYGASDEDAVFFTDKFRERYKNIAVSESVLYPGVAEMLKELKARGKKIAVASSKPFLFLDEISKNLDIAQYYDHIEAESFEHKQSSKKELILSAIEALGSPEKSECIMTGDRFYDIDGAKQAGIDSAGAVFGFGEADELKKAGATYLLFTPSDIYNY